MIINPYKILGVSDKASKDECKKAYRRLCAKYHPDNGGDPNKFDEVNKAWQMIENGTIPKPAPTIIRRGLRHTSIFNFELV